MAAPVSYPATAEGLLALMQFLRSPQGCPWDREQTAQSLTPHLAGECAELIDAIENGSAKEICDECGDLLMNIFLQIAIAGEKGDFTLEDVWQNEIAKMIRRHDHIFGGSVAENAGDVRRVWEQVKARERANGERPASRLDKVPHSLSALTRGEKLQKQAAKANFDWNCQRDILAKIREELDELEQAMAEKSEDEIDSELGDLLFAAVNLIRFRKRKDAESIMRQANHKFEMRFREVEKQLDAAGKTMENTSIDELEEYWQAAKKRGL